MFTQTNNFSLNVIFSEKKNGDGIVFICVLIERKQIKKTTGINCSKNNFVKNAKDFKYVVKNDSQYLYKNQQIKMAYNDVEKSLLQAITNYGILNYDIAKMAINNKTAKSNTLLEYAKLYIANKPISDSTKKRYDIIIRNVIGEFASSTSIIEITPKWLHFLHDRLLNVNCANGKPYNKNTIWTIFKFIRSVINYAMDLGVQMDYPFGSKRGTFTMPEYKNPKRNYLTDTEIEKIKAFNNSPNVLHRNVSRWFILQCRIGCRASDLPHFSKDSIKDNKYYITDVKTKNSHYVPLYPVFVEAINNIDCRMYSYDVYNRTLRDIGKAIGLQFTLTTHVARHTFAISFLNKGGSYDVLKPIMGITLDDTVRIYGKITNLRVDIEVKNILG
jgi:integrase/recombinase XerD